MMSSPSHQKSSSTTYIGSPAPVPAAAPIATPSKWYETSAIKIIGLSLSTILSIVLAIIAIIFSNNLRSDVDASKLQLATITTNIGILTPQLTSLTSQVQQAQATLLTLQTMTNNLDATKLQAKYAEIDNNLITTNRTFQSIIASTQTSYQSLQSSTQTSYQNLQSQITSYQSTIQSAGDVTTRFRILESHTFIRTSLPSTSPLYTSGYTSQTITNWKNESSSGIIDLVTNGILIQQLGVYMIGYELYFKGTCPAGGCSWSNVCTGYVRINDQTQNYLSEFFDETQNSGPINLKAIQGTVIYHATSKDWSSSNNGILLSINYSGQLANERTNKFWVIKK